MSTSILVNNVHKASTQDQGDAQGGSGQTPVGVVAVWTDSSGSVIANAADFDNSNYGGFSLKESQSRRARRMLARNLIHAYASEPLAIALLEDADEIMRNMERLKQGRCMLIHVGSSDE